MLYQTILTSEAEQTDVSITLENAQRVGKYLNTTASIIATVIELDNAPPPNTG